MRREPTLKPHRKCLAPNGTILLSNSNPRTADKNVCKEFSRNPIKNMAKLAVQSKVLFSFNSRNRVYVEMIATASKHSEAL